jgi:SAM-dependent methyltransferase
VRQGHRYVAVDSASKAPKTPKAIYNTLGEGYALRREPDQRIADSIVFALGSSQSVINVGAGTGSYEPTDRHVFAVEPSELMISQRPAGAARCVIGSAESLPADNRAFDAAMAVLTIHHWSDWRQGLREMRRVARQRVVLVSFDDDACNFWLTRDYFAELLAADREIMPTLDALQDELGLATVLPLPVPHDCSDGFAGAYWRRPEVYLDPAARRSMSPFARIDARAGLERLTRDLENGTWHERNADILHLDALDVGYRLLIWNCE